MSTYNCKLPLITLCDSDGRINVKVQDCDTDSCAPEVIQLRLTKQGCTEYIQECVEEEVQVGCGGCPTIVTRPKWVEKPIPTPFVCYKPLEINEDGMAVFALDNTFKELGYGRYRASLEFKGCESLLFDVDYICSNTKLTVVSTTKQSKCGAN